MFLTKIPLPFSIEIIPFALKVLSASLTAVLLTPNWLHISISEGSLSPGGIFLATIASSIFAATLWLNNSLFPTELKILITYYFIDNMSYIIYVHLNNKVKFFLLKNIKS